MSQFQNDSIFWIEVDKIKPNPYQPRKEFDETQLKALSDSIRQYGVLQALVVTRNEITKEDGGLAVEYELIAGERRLRASKLAGVQQVPCLIRVGEETDLMKLELAIIENVQREDLNPVDRARAFEKLANQFGFKHAEIAEKIGKSREYVSNSLRLLGLPSDILDALSAGKISEGHARPLMMLVDRPMEQSTLFKEIMFKKMTVREAELIARKIAVERARKKEFHFDAEVADIEKKLADTLGTRVHIEPKQVGVGGKLTIDFFSTDDLRMILDLVNSNRAQNLEASENKEVVKSMMEKYEAAQNIADATPLSISTSTSDSEIPTVSVDPDAAALGNIPADDRTPVEKKEEENEDIYSVSNFSI